MDYHKCLDLLHRTEEEIWVAKINEVRNDGALCAWLTTLVPGQASCRLDGGFFNGSYNLCQRLVTSDGTVLLLRLPRISSISSDYADEKVAMEVEALDLIQKKTTIPVPQLHAWALAKDNPLGLGPFMLMEFIDGVCLKELFLKDARLLKEEIPDSDVKFIYRQMANFMLQLFNNINFPHTGSLPTPTTGFSAPVRPLSWKVHDILQSGGGFPTAGEYFRYTMWQDEQQLQHQPNSVTVEQNGGSRFASLKILQSMMPGMVNEKYDQGPFKLICDDLSPANVIVRSQHDLTIVGVVGLEWVYAGPAQLFASAPWWLLLDRPVNEDWDFVAGETPEVSSRYFRHLDMFKQILNEEEAKSLEYHEREVSQLVQWYEDSGAIWLHMLVSSGFFRLRVGVKRWREQMNKIKSTEEEKEFIAKKLCELAVYDEQVDRVEHYKALVDRGAMTREEFVATVRAQGRMLY
ncbi:hypothetical protein BDW62DRAFT_212561 [Aspergillus aurantiobrunneus]